MKKLLISAMILASVSGLEMNAVIKKPAGVNQSVNQPGNQPAPARGGAAVLTSVPSSFSGLLAALTSGIPVNGGIPVQISDGNTVFTVVQIQQLVAALNTRVTSRGNKTAIKAKPKAEKAFVMAIAHQISREITKTLKDVLEESYWIPKWLRFSVNLEADQLYMAQKTVNACIDKVEQKTLFGKYVLSPVKNNKLKTAAGVLAFLVANKASKQSTGAGLVPLAGKAMLGAGALAGKGAYWLCWSK